MESQPPEGHDRAARRPSRSLIADLDAVVWEADAATGTFVYVSDGIERILGLAPTAWMRGREGWLASIHPEDRDLVDDARARAAATGLAFDLAYRLVGADGDPVRVRDLGHVVPAEGDRPPLLRGIIVPAADDGPGAELLDTEARYRTLIEQLPAIVYSEDVESDRLRLVYVNPRVQELLGITPEEWIADAGVWLRTIHPDDLDRVRRENERTEATGEPFSIEYRMIARDGRVVWFRDEAVLVCDEADGTPRYWQGVMIDITDRQGRGDPAGRGRGPVPGARGADAHDHLHRRARRPGQHALHQPADHDDPRLLAPGLVRRPEPVERRSSIRRTGNGPRTPIPIWPTPCTGSSRATDAWCGCTTRRD